MSASHHLVSRASWFLNSGFRGSTLPGAKILSQITQHRVAVRIRNHRAQPFHFFQLVGPLLAGEVLLGDAGRVVTLRAGSFDLRLHGSGRKRFTGRARSLRGGEVDGRKQKHCRNDSLEQAGFPTHSRLLEPIRVAPTGALDMVAGVAEGLR